ncbi:MAG: hypothetical protein C0597_14475 [Marinilabiliales bacterium]|nr:MAG: hypothetical protein C0597_14475 [Marinilabiliales bacterium]
MALIMLVLMVQHACIVDQNKYKESDIFEEFETHQGFTILHIPPVLFKIVFSLSDEDKNESKELIDKIKVVKVLFFEEKDNTIKISELNSSINENIKEFQYNLLTRIAEEDNDISIYIIDKEKVINEVLIIIESEKDYLGLNLIGELTKEEVLKVYKLINTQNIQNIEN